MPCLLYFVNSASLVSKVWLDVTARATWGVKVNLSQSSCYLTWRPIFNLTFGGQNVYVSMRLGERSTMVFKWIRYLSQFGSYSRKTTHFKIAIYFTLTRPAGVKILHKEVNSTWVPMDSERPEDSFGFCPAALSQLEAKWHGVPPSAGRVPQFSVVS